MSRQPKTTREYQQKYWELKHPHNVRIRLEPAHREWLESQRHERGMSGVVRDLIAAAMSSHDCRPTLSSHSLTETERTSILLPDAATAAQTPKDPEALGSLTLTTYTKQPLARDVEWHAWQANLFDEECKEQAMERHLRKNRDCSVCGVAL